MGNEEFIVIGNLKLTNFEGKAYFVYTDDSSDQYGPYLLSDDSVKNYLKNYDLAFGKFTLKKIVRERGTISCRMRTEYELISWEPIKYESKSSDKKNEEERSKFDLMNLYNNCSIQ